MHRAIERRGGAQSLTSSPTTRATDRLNVILLPFLGVQRISSKTSIPLLLKGIVNDFPFSMGKAGGTWRRCSMTVQLAYRFERTK